MGIKHDKTMIIGYRKSWKIL